jgi:hypothetical protein
MQGCLKNNTNPILKMEIIFPKSLARPPRWVRFALPNENWALWRVWAMLINSCVIASPADFLAGLQAKGSNSRLPAVVCKIKSHDRLAVGSALKISRLIADGDFARFDPLGLWQGQCQHALLHLRRDFPRINRRVELGHAPVIRRGTLPEFAPRFTFHLPLILKTKKPQAGGLGAW